MRIARKRELILGIRSPSRKTYTSWTYGSEDNIYLPFRGLIPGLSGHGFYNRLKRADDGFGPVRGEFRV